MNLRLGKWIFLAVIIGLAAFRCTPTQISEVAAGIQSACADASKALTVAQSQAKGGALNTVNSIGPYVVGACSTATAIAALAQNSGTLQWLGQLTGMLSATAGTPLPSS